MGSQAQCLLCQLHTQNMIYCVQNRRSAQLGPHLCRCMAVKSWALWEAGSTVLLVPHRSCSQLSSHAGQRLHTDRLCWQSSQFLLG